MKKIGIVDNVELYGPGKKKFIYKIREVDGYVYVYVSYLSAIIRDVAVGDIIEYDEETNTINSLDPFRKLTESEMNQINYIYQQYMKILNRQPNFDLIIQSLLGCSNTDEMNKILKQFQDNSFNEGIERFNAEIILKSINKQIGMRNQLMYNIGILKK